MPPDLPGMPEAFSGSTLPSIAVLPPTTVRQIGSSQVLVDPSSVVKELIDNALDARARSIFVDINANTLDSIQVRDDGHGIPAEDRALACRRYCTSKIRDFQDLKTIGGQWLGFRGEALASMAEMSGTLTITTRVEGEPVAVQLKYRRNGELASTERGSHPVGTTVKVTNFFESAPVRKQTALKSSARWLAKVRSIIQAYALARPAVRFRLHVLKAKNNKSDFIYAPKTTANVEDAVFKIMGKDCALQCDWTLLESDGFEMHAYLPKPTAIGSKIANYGSFISIDSRPVSPSRGILKKIASTFKKKLNKSNPLLESVRDPFFFLNIQCPPDSYDPNIEPAKDDVMFEDGEAIVSMFDKLLTCYYPEVIHVTEVAHEIEEVEISEPSTLFQHHRGMDIRETPSRPRTPELPHEVIAFRESEVARPSPRNDQPLWTSSMHGIDEEDVGITQNDQQPDNEEEGERMTVAVSNPWTIARMNAPLKLKRPNVSGQLLSPAKSQISEPNSPDPVVTHQAQRLEPPTSRSPSRAILGLLEEGSQRTAHHTGPHSSEEPLPIRYNEQLSTGYPQDRLTLQPEVDAHGGSCETRYQLPTSIFESNRVIDRPMQQRGISLVPVGMQLPPLPPKPRRRQAKHQPYNNRQPASPVEQEQRNDTWFGQPMRGTQPDNSSRPKNQKRRQEAPALYDDSPGFPVEVLIEERPQSPSNADIRSFFTQRKEPPGNPTFTEATSVSTPTNSALSGPLDIISQLRIHADREPQTLHSVPRPTPRCPSKPQCDRSTYPRTSSSNLLLERVPSRQRTHALIQHHTISLIEIACAVRTQADSRDSIPWNKSAGDSYAGFEISREVFASNIAAWAGKLDELLCARGYESSDGVDVRGVLRSGMQTVLGVRRPEGKVVDLCDEDDNQNEDTVVTSVEAIKVEDEGDDEMLMDTSGATSKQSVAKIETKAREILTLQQNDRPIIFVAHSLGGLVVEQALLISRGSSQPHVKALLLNVSAIAFMGTPHLGSRQAEWAQPIARLSNLLRKTNKEIVAVLRPGSEMLANLQQEFHTMLEDRRRNEGKWIEIFCFYEELPYPAIGDIVPRQSAILPEYPNASIHQNHSNMTKFSGETDSGYIRVRDQLWLWVNALNASDKKSGPTSGHAHAQVQDTLPGAECALGHGDSIATKTEKAEADHHQGASSVISGGGPFFMGNIKAGRDFNYNHD